MFNKITANDLTQIALSTAFLAVASLIIIPVGMVPITLQVILFLLIPAIIGPVKGVTVIGLYILTGLIGLPVFAGGVGGIGQFLSPSFGYILGAMPVAWLIGNTVDPTKSKRQTGFIMMLGVVLLYITGIAYQYVLLKGVLNTPVALSTLLKTNMTIFLPIDSLKVLTAVGVYDRLKHLSFYKRIHKY